MFRPASSIRLTNRRPSGFRSPSQSSLRSRVKPSRLASGDLRSWATPRMQFSSSSFLRSILSLAR